ncbi:NADH-quinone oxidoreductase subunit NuoE [soil metagenome]
MAVRRLAEKQPESFAFTPANLAWAKKEIAKYPAGRQASAVISLLWRTQEQEGWVTEPAIRAVSEILEMPKIRVLEIATFYTMFLLEPVGRVAHIQVCGTTPCWLRGANDIKEVCRHRIHHDQHHISADGAFSWEEVECIGACVNAPLVQINADTYEDLTVDSFNKLIDDLAAGRPLKPGPQIERHFAAPVGGLTSLTEDTIFGPRPRPQPAAPVLTDDVAKKPTEGASAREAPKPTAPVAANPEDKKPNPVSKV